MAGHTYVTKVASNNTNFPAQEGGYAYRPEQQVKWYVVETTVERVRVPASRYTRYGGAPLRNELQMENILEYAPDDHHEGYEQLHGSDYTNSSPPRYHEEGNLMANFLNKLQIGARPPTKTSELSSPNKYRPTNPNKYRPTSPNRYRPTSPTRYRPTSSTKYRPTSPIKYLPTSPSKHRPTSPSKYLPTSSNKYHPTSPTKYRPTSPTKYRPTSPTKYNPTSPKKYHSTSPTKYLPTSPIKENSPSPKKYLPTSPNKHRPANPNKFLPISSNKYRPTSPNKYRPTSPNKYRPTSPNNYHPTSADRYQPLSPNKHRPISSAHSYPSKEAHVVKAQDPKKYRPTSPPLNYPSKEDYMNRSQDFPEPYKYQPINPAHGFPLKEGQPIRTQSLSDPNKNHSLILGEGARHIRATDYSSPNYHWQNAGPPTTRHPLMAVTNDINEALGFLIESTNYSPRSNPKREGAFDNMSPRAQPIEQERRYARPAFGVVTNRTYLRQNTIDSEEAVRRYNGAYVP